MAIESSDPALARSNPIAISSLPAGEDGLQDEKSADSLRKANKSVCVSRK